MQSFYIYTDPIQPQAQPQPQPQTQAQSQPTVRNLVRPQQQVQVRRPLRDITNTIRV
jgi:hypothetical protein